MDCSNTKFSLIILRRSETEWVQRTGPDRIGMDGSGRDWIQRKGQEGTGMEGTGWVLKDRNG